MLAVTLIVIATVFYWVVEGWSLIGSAFFSVATIATVGYGVPQTVIGKIFTISYIFAGIGIFEAAATAFAQAVLRAGPTPRESEIDRPGWLRFVATTRTFDAFDRMPPIYSPWPWPHPTRIVSLDRVGVAKVVSTLVTS